MTVAASTIIALTVGVATPANASIQEFSASASRMTPLGKDEAITLACDSAVKQMNATAARKGFPQRSGSIVTKVLSHNESKGGNHTVWCSATADFRDTYTFYLPIIRR